MHTHRTRPRTLVHAWLAVVLAGVLVLAGAPSAEAKQRFAKYAETARGDGTLRKGCHNYRYKYRITPPKQADSWGLELFLTDPTGEDVASGGELFGSDPPKGKGRFRVCSTSTEPGTFKIRGKFTYYVGWDRKQGWIKPTRFRLERAG